MPGDAVAGNAWLIASGWGTGVTVTINPTTLAITTTGTPADPGATPTVAVTDPLGAVTTPTPAHPSTGVYTITQFCPTPGVWEAVFTVPPPNTGYGVAKITWTVAST